MDAAFPPRCGQRFRTRKLIGEGGYFDLLESRRECPVERMHATLYDLAQQASVVASPSR